MEARPGTAKGDSDTPARIVVVAVTRLYREGLAHLLARDPRVEVAATADGVRSARAAIAAAAPDGVLLDVALATDRLAVDALSTARGEPALPVVAFGVGDDRATWIACAEAGVGGYVSCDAGIDELVAAVLGAIRGEVVCDPRLTGTLLRHVFALARDRRDGDAQPDARVRLTGREAEIIALVDDGLSNKEIAARLQISLPTVKKHIHNLLGKLGASRRGEAAAHARALQLRIRDGIS